MKISATGKRRFNQLIYTNLGTPSGFSWNNSSRAIQSVRVFFEQTSYKASNVTTVWSNSFTLYIYSLNPFYFKSLLKNISNCLLVKLRFKFQIFTTSYIKVSSSSLCYLSLLNSINLAILFFVCKNVIQVAFTVW